MSALDVHVLSSCAEGFPNVVAEAMAAGALCVVTDVGDAAMIVNGNGWVVPAADSDALGRAIASAVYALGTDKGAELAGSARDTVTGRYGQIGRGSCRERVCQLVLVCGVAVFFYKNIIDRESYSKICLNFFF